jgi:hypothetical protein
VANHSAQHESKVAMSNALAPISILYDASPQSPALSVVAHQGGWAIKHGDSFLGSTALLADALGIMATLADHVAGSFPQAAGGRSQASC